MSSRASDKGAPQIEVRNLSKVYPNGLRALDNINVSIKKGEFVAIIGSSGAGKSTFIRSINRLVQPTSGTITINGKIATGGGNLRYLRRDVAMIFQQFNLVKRLTVLRNVLMGRLGYKGGLGQIYPVFNSKDIDLALNSLQRLGIAEKAYIRADQLSGGQQQRVAIARALTQVPSIMLADEPVASLDPETSIVVLDILKRINHEDGITTIVNLHQLDLAKEYADRVLGFKGGKLVFEGAPEDVTREVYERVYR
ncbi:MAG: phosphonate ABC transporter ATP-binding protein [Chloroflexi bacterium]|nr:phosphonate ABC transporter ATP-binding protein [Chloroflexota bacterium]OJV93706.1 MAG: phosphonate ABC transporter ATP-binding protein [Chloroflexi bacterium 54-19]